MNEQRIQKLKEFYKQEPDDPFNVYALAMEYYEEHPDQSLTLLEGLAENHPDYLPTYYKLGHLLWDLDQLKEAETFLSKGIELATSLNDQKSIKELSAAHQNLLIELD